MAPILIIFLTIITTSLTLNNSEFAKVEEICGSSKYISKCLCTQESDKFENIPLYNVDCSRLEFDELSEHSVWPLLIGHLDLSHNKFENLLNSSRLTSNTLYSLDYSYNKIENITKTHFDGLTNLRNLNLAHNKINEISVELFEKLNNLQVLNLEANRIKILPNYIFHKLISLEELNLNYNPIGKFIEDKELQDFIPKTLKVLYLDKINLNKLETSTFLELKSLEKLTLKHNSISELPYLPLTYLKYFDISATNISNLTAGSLMFPYLKTLKLNRLPLTRINDYTFFNLKNLEELHIEYCTNLKEIDPLVFGYLSINETSENYSLKKLYLNHNRLTYLPNTFENILQNVDEIYLMGNQWHCDCKIGWLQHLNNKIKEPNHVRCFSPEETTNKTVLNLTENLPCLEKKFLEKTSTSSIYKPIENWVFLLVGTLGMIVLILVSVLIYMGPYGTHIYKANLKHLGPDSPYNQITIRPNQAEYINSLI